MTEVTLAIVRRSNIRFVAYLIESSLPGLDVTHGSANGDTYERALNAGYRMARRKSLKVISVFDEEENKHFPPHRYYLGDQVKIDRPKASEYTEAIEELLPWNEDGVPLYSIRCGEAGCYRMLETELVPDQDYQPLPESGEVPPGNYMSEWGRVWVRSLSEGKHETHLEGCNWVYPNLVDIEIIQKGFQERNLQRGS